MKKNVEISRHVNLFDEAYFFLYFWANHDNMTELKAQYADNYEHDLDNYNKKVDLIIEMYQSVKDNLKTKKEQVDYYLKDRNNDFSTFGALALLWDQHYCDRELEPYEKHYEAITEVEKIQLFAKIISCDDADNTSEDELRNLGDLLNFIDSSGYDKEAKWEAVKIYNHTETYYNEMYQLLKDTVELLQKKFSSQIAAFEQNFYQYWTEFQKKENLLDALEEKLNISWKQDGNAAFLIPIISLPFTVAISIDSPNQQHRDVIRMSVIMDQRFASAGRKVKKEDIIKIGKLLSDKSKIDILEYVSQRPAYGKEIADELHLSTATISYHVNALFNMGFLSTSINSNKVYYSINQAKISSHLEDIKNYFTQL